MFINIFEIKFLFHIQNSERYWDVNSIKSVLYAKQKSTNYDS